MRRCRALVFVASVAAVWGAAALAAACSAGAGSVPAARGTAARPTGSWGRAIEVPGLAALNRGGLALVNSVSCASAGNCAAGGYYRNHGYQGFVASERRGRWGRAIEVPGLGALNKGDAGVNSVSCASAGNCAAGGFYTDQQGFVVSERNGVWGQAVAVPGLRASEIGLTGITSVSCGSAGSCAAGGGELVVSEKNGRWGRPIEVPGLAALNTRGSARVTSVSCASAGNCAAGGYYRNHGLLVSERNGRWGRAFEVPGMGGVSSVWCGSAGSCAAGGGSFVAVEENGRWGRPVKVPAGVAFLSCASPGNCVAGGDSGSPYGWGWVFSERNGVWGRAIGMPAPGAMANGRFAGVFSVSCAPAGNCAAGGDYEHMSPVGDSQGFVASEENGVWGRAMKVPGLGTLNTAAGAAVTSVSCVPAGSCTAGGYYQDRHGQQGFVT